MSKSSPLFGELDAKIEAAMAAYGIPGVAAGVLYDGREYLKGYGVTNVNYPRPVDPDTVFRIGSTTKTYTGTAAMRLVERGRLDLDARVRSYLPDFQTSDRAVAERVTLRQLLNHTPGWLGEYFESTGRGTDALARYTAGIAGLPQLTPPGTVFFYNNAGVALAGRVIEVVTGKPYEAAVRSLVLDPLGLSHSCFFSDEIVGFNVAASHKLVDGKPVVEPSYWFMPRAMHPTGGLISSVRDQLAYARFHLGDGTGPDGKRLLRRRSLERMRSDPGPGGTLGVEVEGVGVTWQLRPSSQGVRIVQQGGTYLGQHTGFMMAPDRGFALVVLTNSDGGMQLLLELFIKDWALRAFAGLSNLPAAPQVLTRDQLSEYEGRYVAQELGDVEAFDRDAVGRPGQRKKIEAELRRDKGQLRVMGQEGRLAFYRKDQVLVLDPAGQPIGPRYDFVRDNRGHVKWLRMGGLYRHRR